MIATQAKYDECKARAVHALGVALGAASDTIRDIPAKAAMFEFSLPGDRVSGGGRMMVKPDGEVLIWHRMMAKPWLSSPFERREIGGLNGRGPIPGFRIGLEQFEGLEPNRFASVRGKSDEQGVSAAQKSRTEIGDDQVRSLAIQSLAAFGWTAAKESNGITYLNDGEGRSLAGRLTVNKGIASFWSHRGGEAQVGAPWREGRDLKSGVPTVFATARDLAGLGLQIDPTPAPADRPHSVPVSDDRKIAAIQATWARMQANCTSCPPDHRHLMKGVANAGHALPAEGLQVLKDGKYKGAIVIPMLREAHESAPGQLHTVGVQTLLTSSMQEGNDKMLLANSSMSGSFTPWPLPQQGNDGRYDLEHWVNGMDKTKPIVLCEGVATGLAIHHSGAGHAVICYSAANLKTVARYFSDREFDSVHGIVVAADNDIGLKRSGGLKSDGVLKSIEAARECGGEVSFMGRSRPSGHDARALYVSDGADAVRRYIATAQKPEDVQRRFENVIELRKLDAGIER